MTSRIDRKENVQCTTVSTLNEKNKNTSVKAVEGKKSTGWYLQADRIKMEILSFSSFRDLASVCGVSREFKTLVKRCVSLKSAFNLGQRLLEYSPFFVFEMPNVTVLDLSHLPLKIVRRILCDGKFAENRGPHIRSLSLKNVWSYEKPFYGRYYEFEGLGKADLQKIAAIFRNLQEFTLESSSKITLRDLCILPKTLKKLSIRDSSHLFGHESDNVKIFGQLASSYPSLEIFEIDGIKPTIEIYSAILEALPNLKRCSFPEWDSPDDMKTLETSYPNCSFASSSVHLYVSPSKGYTCLQAEQVLGGWLGIARPILEKKDYRHVTTLRISNPFLFNTEFYDPKELCVKPDDLKFIAKFFPSLEHLHIYICKKPSHRTPIKQIGKPVKDCFDSIQALSSFPHLQSITFHASELRAFSKGNDQIITTDELKKLSKACRSLCELDFKEGIKFDCGFSIKPDWLRKKELGEFLLEHFPLLRSYDLRKAKF